MEMKPVKSNVIQSIGHDSDNNILAIQFASGQLYHYFGVLASEYEKLQQADSAGRHAAINIYPHYKFKRIE